VSMHMVRVQQHMLNQKSPLGGNTLSCDVLFVMVLALNELYSVFVEVEFSVSVKMTVP